MKTTIKIGSQLLEMEANAFTPILYRRVFRSDFIRSFTDIISMNKELVEKATEIKALKESFEAGEITSEEYTKRTSEFNFSSDEMDFIYERAELLSQLAFIMNAQSKESDVRELTKLDVNDFYSFLMNFDDGDFRDGVVISKIIAFWKGNAEDTDVEAKNE